MILFSTHLVTPGCGILMDLLRAEGRLVGYGISAIQQNEKRSLLRVAPHT